MLTMESRIHGDMYVRFGGRLAETYHREMAKRCWPSLLKEIASLCSINKKLTTHCGRHTFGTIMLTKGVSIESVSKMLGHTNITTTQIYAKILNEKISVEVNKVRNEFDVFQEYYKQVK